MGHTPAFIIYDLILSVFVSYASFYKLSDYHLSGRVSGEPQQVVVPNSRNGHPSFRFVISFRAHLTRDAGKISPLLG